MTGQLTFEVMDLLCSRLCHDLISPVGAINNGVELIEEMGDDMVDEAMGLISQSGRRAAGHLRCYRLCYGAAGAQANVGMGEAREIAAGYLEGGKVTLGWDVPGDLGGDDPPPGIVKVLLNLIVMADESLSQGGRISVGGDGGVLTVTAEGPNAGLREHQDAALAGTLPMEELGARTVHAYVTGLFAQRFGMTVDHSMVETDKLRLQLTLR